MMLARRAVESCDVCRRCALALLCTVHVRIGLSGSAIMQATTPVPADKAVSAGASDGATTAHHAASTAHVGAGAGASDGGVSASAPRAQRKRKRQDDGVPPDDAPARAPGTCGFWVVRSPRTPLACATCRTAPLPRVLGHSQASLCRACGATGPKGTVLQDAASCWQHVVRTPQRQQR